MRPFYVRQHRRTRPCLPECESCKPEQRLIHSCQSDLRPDEFLSEIVLNVTIKTLCYFKANALKKLRTQYQPGYFTKISGCESPRRYVHSCNEPSLKQRKNQHHNVHQRLEFKNWSLKISLQCTWAPAAHQRRHFSKKTMTFKKNLHVAIIPILFDSFPFLCISKCTLIWFSFVHSLFWNLNMFMSYDESNNKQFQFQYKEQIKWGSEYRTFEN